MTTGGHEIRLVGNEVAWGSTCECLWRGELHDNEEDARREHDEHVEREAVGEHFAPGAVDATATLAAKIHAENPDLPKLAPLPRMRIEHGRVMHAVEARGSGSDIRYESKCRRGSGIAGVSATYPRAQGPVSWWTAERLWYPDCRHCPVDES